MTMCSIKSEKNSKNEARTWYFDLKARPLSSVSIESNFENDDVSEVVTVSNLLLTSVLEESFIWRSMSPKWAILNQCCQLLEEKLKISSFAQNW